MPDEARPHLHREVVVLGLQRGQQRRDDVLGRDDLRDAATATWPAGLGGNGDAVGHSLLHHRSSAVDADDAVLRCLPHHRVQLLDGVKHDGGVVVQQDRQHLQAVGFARARGALHDQPPPRLHVRRQHDELDGDVQRDDEARANREAQHLPRVFNAEGGRDAAAQQRSVGDDLRVGCDGGDAVEVRAVRQAEQGEVDGGHGP